MSINTTASSPKHAKLRIVCIADTHNQTPALPAGDILVHAGDLTNQGSHLELQRQLTWLQAQRQFAAKIVVAGNHDVTLDADFAPAQLAQMHNQSAQDPAAIRAMVQRADGITYLAHESKTMDFCLAGQQQQADEQKISLRVFGSPYSHRSSAWAFGYEDAQAHDLWAAIPDATDLLVTHGPPRGICDVNREGEPDGCSSLLKALERVRPRLHVCGHRHEGRGAAWLHWAPESGSIAQRLRWVDPGGMAGRKISLVDFTGRKGREAWVEESAESLNEVLNGARRRSAGPGGGTASTCVVNAAVVARSFSRGAAKEFNKPIVVDLEIP